MARDTEGLKMWKALYAQWQETQQQAFSLRRLVTTKQINFASGHGPDKTAAELDEVDRLERLATKLAVEMNNFVTNRMS